MKYEAIIKILAPCGLSCGKCMAFAEGNIKTHAQEIQKRLGSFDIYAERFSNLISPVFKHYPAFKELLNYFAQGNCKGCRTQKCGILPNCGVAPCYQQKGVDFCFQCDEFPCEKTNFDSHLKQRWLKMNNRMKEIGIEAYFEETKDLPRYI